MLTGTTKIKINKLTIDKRKIYQIGQTSETTGLIKTANGWEKPKQDRQTEQTSTEKAKSLKASDWGTTKEIIEMATPKRKAISFDAAKECMNEFMNKELKSKNGLPGTITGKSRKEMLSGAATSKSINIHQHLMAVANADQLYQNSIEPFPPEPDRHGNENVKCVHKTYAPFLVDIDGEKKVIPVKFTVKEYKPETNNKNKLYCIEAIDFEIPGIKKENMGNSPANDHVQDAKPAQALIMFSTCNLALKKIKVK